MSEKKKSQTDQTVEHLRSLLLSNQYTPGQSLRQAELAELLGVSRTPVREALKELSVEGLVEITPTGRTIVASMDPALIKEHYEIRCQLELWMLGLAIPVMTTAQLDHAEAINEQMAVCGEDEWKTLNIQFHRALCAPANKPHTLTWLEDLNTGAMARLHTLTRSLRNAGRSIRDHRDIVDACRKGDIQAAQDRLCDA